MRAATNVVLRRDLSLNRRLYAWLLGPDESLDGQNKYLKENGLTLLCSTMRVRNSRAHYLSRSNIVQDELSAARPDAFDSRPFKIFISLLDKWEIGQPLADEIILDALKSLRRCSSAVHMNDAENEDVAMTCSTVTEAVEPLVMWKQLFGWVHSEVLGDAKLAEAIPMARFVVASIRTQEEEVDSFHLPLIFSALLELLTTLVASASPRASSETTRGVIQLLLDIFPRIPASAWALSPTKYLKDRHLDSEGGPYLRACKLYGVSTPHEGVQPRPAEEATLVTAFEDLTKLSALFAQSITKGGAEGGASARECLMQTMTLLLKLVRRSEKQSQNQTFDIAWKPKEWFPVILACLDKVCCALSSEALPLNTRSIQRTSFTLIDRVITLAVALAPSNVVKPRLTVDERSFVSKMVTLVRTSCLSCAGLFR